MALAKLIWMPALSQFLVTVGSQLVVSQYVSVPKQFYKSQTTMLLYAYYIGSCLGMVCALSKRTWIGPKTLLIASIVRFAIFPLTLLYITHPNALGPKGSKHADIVVQVINFIFCFTNGHLFSMTYSQANAQFKSPAGVSSMCKCAWVHPMASWGVFFSFVFFSTCLVLSSIACRDKVNDTDAPVYARTHARTRTGTHANTHTLSNGNPC